MTALTNIAWRDRYNAIAFAIGVADLALSAHLSLFPDDVLDALMAQFRMNRGDITALTTLMEQRRTEIIAGGGTTSDREWLRAPWDVADAALKQYQAFRDRYSDDDPRRAVFDLVDVVGFLQYKPDRSASSIGTKIRWLYEYSQKAVLNQADVARLELHHRVNDLTSGRSISDEQRLAFEAAWIAGHRKLAVQILQREAVR